MITTIQQADAMLTEAMADYEADMGEQAQDEVWYDMVVATALSIAVDEKNPDLARDFCHRQVGQIPQDLERYLGKKDWIR